MGLLIDGKWHDQWYDTKSSGGRYERKSSTFRGSIGTERDAEFPAEADRYHLYVSLACPWAHRTLIFRSLLGLEEIISISIVDPFMGVDGWAFSTQPGTIADYVNETQFLRDIYLLSASRSEEHTSELQSRRNLVCRLLLEKKKKNKPQKT